MPDAPPKTGELYKAGLISDNDLDMAVKVFLAKREEPDLIALGKSYRIDVAAAVEAHAPSAAIVADPDASPGALRTAVRTANVLTVPTKA